MKQTIILRDEPVSEDAFGAHERIAEELVRLIQSSNEIAPPRSVGLLGDWGSGKSSVVYMMKKLLAAQGEAASTCHVFIYDAWAHQGDELRRAFLDTLVDSLGEIISHDEREKIKKKIWQKEETIETKSQQVLRRHGKILLVSLLLSPVFIRLYQSPPDQWSELSKCIWNYISFFGIFSPFIAFTLLHLVKVLSFPPLQQLLFGKRNKTEVREIKVSSVFFQRTEGQIDVKTVTSPSDSIRIFSDIFRYICQIAIDSGRKIVFVIDNIDRLDHDEARSFWSTMQSFLDRSLWRRPADANSIFYVVPFSPLAIRSVFASKEGGEGASQSFIDKTFDLSIHVSPPIQVDLRGYLVGLLRSAFPDHATVCLEAVRDIYDYHRAVEGSLGRAGDAEATRRTPRQMKLFVNQLVGLYRLRGEGLALETMAAYLLCQRQINENGIAPIDQLSPQQIYLLPSEPDVVQQMAAVHFGVSLEAAAQVVLFDPIRKALGSEDPSALKRLHSRSGFADVLKLALGAQDGEATVSDVLRLATIVDGLPNSSDETYGQIWSALLNNLRHAKRLGSLDKKPIDGFGCIFGHLDADQRDSFVSILQKGLSGRWAVLSDQRSQGDNETDEAFEQRMALAAAFATCLHGVMVLKLLESFGRVELLAYAGFATRLIDALSKIPDWPEITKHLKLNVFSGDVSAAINNWPGILEGPASPYNFVRTAMAVQGYVPDWVKVANLAIDRASSTSVSPTESTTSLELAMAIAALQPKAGVDKALVGLLSNSAFAAKFSDAEDESYFLGASIAAFLAFGPSLNPESLVLPTGRPAVAMTSLLSGGKTDSDVLDIATELLVSIKKADSVFANVVLYPRTQRVGGEIVSRLIRDGHRFSVSKFMLVRAQGFLANLAGDVQVQSFYEQLASAGSILTELNKGQASEADSQTYIRVANTSWGEKSVALRNRLKKFVQDATSDNWVSTIQAQSDALNLMYTLDTLGKLGLEASLGASASDAVARVVEQAVANNTGISGRTKDVVVALESNIQSNLSSKTWQLLVRATGPEPIASVVQTMPSVVRDSSSRSLSELLNTVFTRTLESKKADLVRWTNDAIQRRESDFQKSLPAIGEFRSRVSGLLKTSGLAKELRAELRGLLQLVPKPPSRRKSGRE